MSGTLHALRMFMTDDQAKEMIQSLEQAKTASHGPNQASVELVFRGGRLVFINTTTGKVVKEKGDRNEIIGYKYFNPEKVEGCEDDIQNP